MVFVGGGEGRGLWLRRFMIKSGVASYTIHLTYLHCYIVFVIWGDMSPNFSDIGVQSEIDSIIRKYFMSVNTVFFHSFNFRVADWKTVPGLNCLNKRVKYSSWLHALHEDVPWEMTKLRSSHLSVRVQITWDRARTENVRKKNMEHRPIQWKETNNNISCNFMGGGGIRVQHQIFVFCNMQSVCFYRRL